MRRPRGSGFAPNSRKSSRIFAASTTAKARQMISSQACSRSAIASGRLSSNCRRILPQSTRMPCGRTWQNGLENCRFRLNFATPIGSWASNRIGIGWLNWGWAPSSAIRPDDGTRCTCRSPRPMYWCDLAGTKATPSMRIAWNSGGSGLRRLKHEAAPPFICWCTNQTASIHRLHALPLLRDWPQKNVKLASRPIGHTVWLARNSGCSKSDQTGGNGVLCDAAQAL